MELFISFYSRNCCKHFDILRWKTKKGDNMYICRNCGRLVHEIEISDEAYIENISNKLKLENASNICRIFKTKVDMSMRVDYEYLPKREYKMKELRSERQKRDNKKTHISC